MQENKEIKMHIFSGCSFGFIYEQCMNELPSPLLVAFGDIRVSVNEQSVCEPFFRNTAFLQCLKFSVCA